MAAKYAACCLAMAAGAHANERERTGKAKRAGAEGIRRETY